MHATELDLAAVCLLVLVDVRRRSRLKALAPLLARIERGDPSLAVHIYDHHPAAEDDLHGAVEVVAPVGSATTLLVEQVRTRGLDVDPLEATLLALGIHADTGSLTYASTTARDAAAVAWLLERGAVLAVLNRYLHAGFTPEQRRILQRALGTARTERIGGADIAFAVVPLERDTSGLDVVTSELAALEGHAALFGIYPLGTRKVTVVARARVPWIDVGRALQRLGGGRHAAAGAAVLKGVSGEQARARITAVLAEDPPRPRTVRDLMTSPVHTVAPDISLRTLATSLATWRHTGVPVVDAGRVVGIVSRRDIEAAARAGQLDEPVSGRMSRDVVTIAPDATLDDALAAMSTANVGRCRCCGTED